MSKATRKNSTARKPSQSKRRKDGTVLSQFDRYPLPFFAAKAKPVPLTWNVKPSGDYVKDCETGRAFAIQFIKTADGTNLWGTLLASITADMIRAGTTGKYANGERKAGGIVVGFMSVIGRAINSPHLNERVAVNETIRSIEDATFAPPGRALRLTVTAALQAHRAIQQTVKALEGKLAGNGVSEAVFNRACDLERKALEALSQAVANDADKATARVVYLECYWRDMGGGGNAWPFLSAAVQDLARFAGKAVQP